MLLPLGRAHIYSLQALLKLSSHRMWCLPESLQSLHPMCNCVCCTGATCSPGKMSHTCCLNGQRVRSEMGASASWIVVHKCACCAAGSEVKVKAAKPACLVSSAGGTS